MKANRSYSSLGLRAVLAAIALGCALPLCASDANPPKGMTYQGYLTDGSGVPLGNGSLPANYDVVFKIYDASSAGNLRWAKKQTVTFDKGQFSVVLGEGAANGSDPRPDISTVFSAADASDRFINITVKVGQTDVEIAPRLRLVTSPYSFLAKSATAVIGADGGTLLASTAPNTLTVSGTLNATAFNGNGAGLTSFTAGQIPNLDAAKITSGTLVDGRLSANVPIMSGGKIGDGNLPTTMSGKIFNSDMQINGAVTLEFGASTVKEVNNGKIGYKKFSSGLDIVGAGTASDASDRRITFHAQGGSQFAGNVGINGLPTGVPLRVFGYGNTSMNASPDGFANNSGFNGCCNLGTAGGGVFPLSILVDQWVGAAGFVANSDRRIKDVTGLSDTHKDLDTILKVRVTDYTLKDKIREGNTPHKGFIAQELATIIPTAVTTTQKEIPDIYSAATKVETNQTSKMIKVTLPSAHQLAKGDVVVVYIDDIAVPQELTVTGTPSATQFEAESQIQPKKMFVYGKRVNDFHTVNYDLVFTTGIGAIQELNKIVQAKEARIAALEEKASKVEALEKEVTALKKQLAANVEGRQRVEARFESLEKMIKSLAAAQPAGGVTVSAVER